VQATYFTRYESDNNKALIVDISYLNDPMEASVSHLAGFQNLPLFSVISAGEPHTGFAWLPNKRRCVPAAWEPIH
jgi:hypothetical protein